MVVLTDYTLGISTLQEWLKTQKHLPQNIGTKVLLRFIYSCNGDLEKTIKLIELNYTLRNIHSHIFLKRDPLDENSKNIMKSTDMLILPGVTPEGNKVLLYRLTEDDNISNFNFTEAVKVFFMLADARFATSDPCGGGEVPIFDMARFSLRHLTKVVISSLRIYMKFTQEAQPIRLKEIHVINCSSFLDKVLTIVKPFIKSEVFKLIKFHLPESDTLYQYVPKDMLPNEYGGKAGSIAEIKRQCIDILIEERDYLMDGRNWKIDETKKCPNKTNSVKREQMSLNENFGSLNID